MNLGAGVARMRKMPLFPLVPLLPLSLLVACVVMSWRHGTRLHLLEKSLSEHPLA